MAGQNRTPFEIIRASRQGQGAPPTPSWWSPEVSTAGRRRGGLIDWITRPIHVRISRLAVLIIALVVAALVGVAFELGARSTPASLAQVGDARSREMLARARMQPAEPELVRPGGESSAGPSGRAAPVPDPRRAVSNVEAVRPEDRVPGLNYFCVMTLRENHRASAERVAKYLRANGVPAGVVETRSGLLQVLALQGFERAGSDAAVDFKRKLTTLGREWQAQGGASDWEGIYAIKYQPTG